MAPSRSFLLAVAPAVAAALAGTIGAQAPDFAASSITYDTSTPGTARFPHAMAQADLDGDGDLDVVATNGANIPKLSVLRNRGNGAFDPAVLYASSTGLFDDLGDVATGDFDHDGDVDVVVANTGNNGFGTAVALHRNRGDGTFAPYVTFPTGQGPAGIVAADLDGDGWLDVATADYGYIGQGTTVSVLRNDQHGGFLAPMTLPVGAGPYRLAAGDLDGDGRIDLAVARDGQKLVVLHNGTAGFTSTVYDVLPTNIAGNGYPVVELADMDRDGDLDVVYTSTKTGFQSSSGRGAVAILPNDGSGQLGAPIALTTVPETQGGVDLAIADWNGDGFLDVASAHLFEGEWLLFESDGSGGFLPPVRMAAGDYAVDIDGADVTGDGRPDVLVLEQFSLGVAVYPNPFGGAIRDPAATRLVNGSLVLGTGLDAADVDLDGDLDVGVSWSGVASNSGGIDLVLNDGQGHFSAPKVFAAPTKALGLELVDLDGDGLADMLWADDFPPYQWHVRINQGNVVFGPVRTFNGTGCKIGDLDAFDFDNDGDLDVAIGHDAACTSVGQPVFLAANDGSGRFSALPVHMVSTFTSVVTHADVDRDGNQDLITNSGFNGIEVSLGHGDGTFAGPILAFTDWGPKAITAGDFDGDGNLDLATSNLGQQKGEASVSVLLGFGDGGFAPPVTYGSAYHPNLGNAGTILAGDTDGDGHLDLMVGHWASQDVSVYHGNGDGTFTPQIRFGAGNNVFGLLWRDFTGDAIEDLGIGVLPGLSLAFYPAFAVLDGTAGSTWKDLGGGLTGSRGVPTLAGSSPFVGGTTLMFDVANAAPSVPGVLVLGLARANLPVLGGTLVPRPDFLGPFTTGAAGTRAVSLPVPAGLPYGLRIWLQAWLVDGGAPQGVAATNALLGTHF